jgi:thioredoxin 1
VLAELARQYAGKVKMGQLNIDDRPRVATQLDGRSIPTLLLFKDGKVSGQRVGAVAKPKIDELVKKCL